MCQQSVIFCTYPYLSASLHRGHSYNMPWKQAQHSAYTAADLSLLSAVGLDHRLHSAGLPTTLPQQPCTEATPNVRRSGSFVQESKKNSHWQ